ncbi:MAG TPA: B-box zinc finger protein [Acidobacteriaceae bacterium]|nr:B-box zinc finger protein [Acidobacteriaceae bacterium]
MNCANHPDIPVAAYCQFCGKPLCDQCAHKVNNIVSCEPCLAARIGAAPPAGSNVGGGAKFVQTPDGIHVSDGKGNEYSAGPGPGYQYISSAPSFSGNVPPSWGTTPWLAFLLGWIPGVGAMYNGQFAKALAHVVIFALLVDFSHYNGVLGVVVFGWVVYQVFDAYQTAIARRDGLPLPNPLGLNDIAHWFGVRPTPSANPWVGSTASPNAANHPPNAAPTGVPPVGSVGPISGFAPASEYVPPYVPPVPPNPADPLNPFCSTGPLGPNRGIHTGAVILIVLGVAFLLGNLGILSQHWINRGWPILLIGIGVWMVICRSQKPPVGGAR